MKMIRLNEESDQQLDEIAKETGETKQDLMKAAVALLARKYFFEKANKAFAELRKDKKAWQEELEERKLWDATLLDGLKDDSYDD